MKKRLNITIIILIILVFVTGVYLYNKNITKGINPYSQTQPLPSNEDIPKNWKTYTNLKYNFEFKYPPEVRLSDQSEGYVSVSYMGEKQKSSGRTQTELFDGYAFNIADVTAGGYRDLDDFYAQKIIQLKEICAEIGNPRETTVSGKKAITQRLSCLNDYDSYYILNNNTYFEISLLEVGEAEDLPEYKELVNKIFSTFRFNN